MARGDKSKYTDKQKRQAEHIEEGYLKRGVKRDEAESRAWATVNAISGGGKKSGSGRGKKTNKKPMQRGANWAVKPRPIDLIKQRVLPQRKPLQLVGRKQLRVRLPRN